jgi:uncharacterized protein (TIGR03000 family)
MLRRSPSTVVTAVLAATLLLLAGSEARAQRYHGGYYHGGYYHGGYYRPWGYYHPYYRPYPVIGIGIGVGFYVPYYGSYAYPVAPTVIAYSGGGPESAATPPGTPPQTPPPPSGQSPGEKPPDNAGHLQLLVPENAEVLVEGTKLGQSGPVREFVSPPVTPGTRYTYKITVRYTDAKGKTVDDTRDIHFQANDWFTIDFTRPAPPIFTPPPPKLAPPPG